MEDFDLQPVAMNMFRSEFQNIVLISDMMVIDWLLPFWLSAARYFVGGGFLPLRGAGTGFVVVLPLSLIFDPPL